MTTTMNGAVRKNLSEQIDRLDSILDGLADGLNGAVADAVRQSLGLVVQEAVKAVMIEVFGNPAVLDKLRASAAIPAAAEAAATTKPTPMQRVAVQVKAWARAGWAKVRGAFAIGRQQAGQAAGAVRLYVQTVWALRTPLLVATGVGVTVGMAAYLSGPWMAATAASLAGFMAATATQATIALRRLLTTMVTTPSDA